jgi:HK97 family phage major capsid protein
LTPSKIKTRRTTLTDEEKKALAEEAAKKAKAAVAEESKGAILEINDLITKQREEYDKFLKGKLAESDFKAFEEKAQTAEKALKERMDTIETKLKRPGGTDPDSKEMSPGQIEYKKSFFNLLRSGPGGHLELTEAGTKYASEQFEKKALVSNTAGQILIPEEVESEIYRALPNINIIRGFATVRTITTDRIRRRSLTEVAMGWGKLELGSSPVEQDVTPTEAYQYVEDLEGLARVGKNELADTDVALEAILVDSFSRARARTEETAFISGTAHANEQPEGILNGSVVTRITGATADVIVVDDFLDLIYGVPAQYRRNGKILVPSTTELAMRKLKSGGSEALYLWQPNVQAGQPATFAGYPVHAQEDIGAIGASDECDIAIFGDIQAGYRIVDRQGMMIQRLLELWATAGLVGLLVSARVTGGVIRADALRVLKEAA